MKQKIRFIKMHGVGNDYIFVNTEQFPITNPSEAAILWSRHHMGIGSDGLVLIGKSSIPEADYTMRIFNADGSEGLMCGNASRCIGKYLYEYGFTRKTTIRLLTASGIKELLLSVDHDDTVTSITVDMMIPFLECSQQFQPKNEPLPEGTFVSMGNPHYVIFVNDVKAIDLVKLGSQLECHPSFPEGCNIEFAQIRPDGIRMRVWERGSGITMACGTGACATAVAAAVTGRSTRCSHVIMDGGSLDITWRESDGHVMLTGSASIVFEGDITL